MLKKFGFPGNLTPQEIKVKYLQGNACPFCKENKKEIQERKNRTEGSLADFYSTGFMKILREDFDYTGEFVFEVDEIVCKKCQSKWVVRSNFGNIDPRDSSFGPDFVDFEILKY